MDAVEWAMSRRYRDLAAWRLGQPLVPWETVHHIDGNHQDDHLDDLRVLPKRAA